MGNTGITCYPIQYNFTVSIAVREIKSGKLS